MRLVLTIPGFNRAIRIEGATIASSARNDHAAENVSQRTGERGGDRDRLSPLEA